MDIKTKFNINDKVWIIHPLSKKAVQGCIKGIYIIIEGKPKHKHSGDGKRGLIRTGEYESQKFVDRYIIDDMITKEGVSKTEYDVYETKEKLIESIKMNADDL